MKLVNYGLELLICFGVWLVTAIGMLMFAMAVSGCGLNFNGGVSLTPITKQEVRQEQKQSWVPDSLKCWFKNCEVRGS